MRKPDFINCKVEMYRDIARFVFIAMSKPYTSIS